MESNAKKMRSSNIELLRIITMLLIVMHHYVVNSGIAGQFDYNAITPNMLFLQFFGMWGKIGINVFILISGYFMCKSRLTVRRYMKVYAEYKFYVILFFIIFAAAGLTALTLKGVFAAVFSTAYNAGKGFSASFMIFYLFIPFYNYLINAMNEKAHRYLLIILFIVFPVFTTVFFNVNIYNEIIWYAAIYFFAAYIRLYPNKYFDKNKYCVPALIVLVLGAFAGIVVIDLLCKRLGATGAYYYYFTDTPAKLLAFLIGIFMFLVFKNIRIKNSKLINIIASTTFGVLLIHAGGDAMRDLIWVKLLHVSEMYTAPLYRLILHAFISCICVFAVCSLIDLARIYALEKPIFKYFDKRKKDQA